MDITAMAFKILKSGKRGRSFCRLWPMSVQLRTFNEIRTRENENASWKVMFFGTDDFSLGSLTRLTKELETSKLVSKLEVVTSKWHQNPVRLYGQKNGLVIHEWPIDPKNIKGFDIGVVASFGHLISKEVINSFPLGMLNVHGSLLPRWRGASPINYAIMHGDQISGISIMRIQPQAFDIGDVVAKREVLIHATEMAPELRQRLSDIGGEEIISCLWKLPTCLTNAKPQPNHGVSYAPKLTTDIGIIKFKNMNARCIYNRYRALYGIIPLTTSWKGLRLSFHNVSASDNLNIQSQEIIGEKTSLSPCVPGQVFFDKKHKSLVIRCIDDSYLIVQQLAPHRKKPMSALEFYNGYLSKQDKTLWIFNDM